MPRSVPEWIGKTDDTAIPPRVKLRIIDRQGGVCACCGRKPLRWEFDHRIALINGGENRETNVDGLCQGCHGSKTTADLATKSKTHRIRLKNQGLKPRGKGWSQRYKKRMDGTVIDRKTGKPVSR